MALSRSDGQPGLLAALSEEITQLVTHVVRSTAIVAGQTKDFGEATGSAWLYQPEYLVTNNHVVCDLVAPIWVRMADQQDLPATLVGRDPMTDLAVLQVPKQEDAPPLKLRSTAARLGELCFALGSPLGEYPESVSIGIVSGLRRRLPVTDSTAIFDVIQTDCAINPGNSGGPLVSAIGEVLGVNTAARRSAEGIGFAVPAETVADIAPELIAHGAIERASLGISVVPRVVDAGAPSRERLVVTAVRNSSAGPFQVGDVLLQIGPHEVKDQQDLLRLLRRDLVNQKVPVRVSRDGKPVAIEVVPSRLQ